MNINIHNIKPGKYRSFTRAELLTINNLVGNSSKTEEAS
jgi:hypothetical protein